VSELDREGIHVRIAGEFHDDYVPIVHMCPPDGSGEMPCCGLPPFERMRDRMTLDPALVTCELDAEELHPNAEWNVAGYDD
jgi:hypothetical protein